VLAAKEGATNMTSAPGRQKPWRRHCKTPECAKKQFHQNLNQRSDFKYQWRVLLEKSTVYEELSGDRPNFV
jgi:hypothetical protein